MARDLREQNNDVQELLQTKDAQLAVLRVRLDEADHKLKEKQMAAEGAVAEKQRYVVSDHAVILFFVNALVECLVLNLLPYYTIMKISKACPIVLHGFFW